MERRTTNRPGDRPRAPAPRIPLLLPVRFGSNGTRYDEVTLNVSMGGMFIRTDHYVRPGSTLEMEFSIASGEAIHARGRVVWASEGVPENQFSFTRGLGIEFIDLPKEVAASLTQLSQNLRNLP